MIKYQKVIKVGNSLAVTLDSDFVKKTGIGAGDNMAASYKPEKELLSVARTSKALKKVAESEGEAYTAGKVTPEFQMWVEKSLDEDKEAMKALKDL